MWKKIRKNYRRLIASLLTLAMVVTNAGGNLGTVFAAGESENALFLVDGEELREAIREAEELGEVFDFASLRLAAKRKSIRTRYEKLLGKKEGKVYALDLEIDDSYAPEGTELQVFYHAGTEDVIFLFLNESDLVVDYRVNIDGYETEPVRVSPNTANIEMDGEETPSYAENYEAADMIDDESKKLGAEVVGSQESSAAEENGRAAEDTEDESIAAGEETGAEVNGETDAEDESKNESQDTVKEPESGEESGEDRSDEEAGEESEASEAGEDQTEEPAGDKEEESEAEETEAESEEETEAATEEEPEADAEDGELLSLSRHEAALVAVSLEDLEEGEPEIVEETEAEPEEEETGEETEAEPESESQEEESESGTEAESKPEETEEETEGESKPKESVAATEGESKSEESKPEESEAGTEAESKPEESEAETGKDIIIEETKGEEPTEEIRDDENSADLPDSDSNKGGKEDLIEMDGQLLEDDDVEILGELKGKEYDTVTILDHVNARALKIAWEDIDKIITSDGMDYAVDYVVNLPEGAEVTGADTVAEGEDLYFAVDVEDGYELAAVYANGSEVEELDNASDLASASNWKGYSHVYVVKGVTEDLWIDVEVEELKPVIAAATYTKETDDAVFMVSVPDEAFMEEVELEVTKIEDEDHIEELKAQANDLLKEGQTVADILVYDVTFVSKETGEEVEPTKTVGVSARMKAPVVSEENVEKNVNITEISVVHLPDEKEAEVVASTENAEETEFEFQTESFSEIMFLAMTEDEPANGVAKIVSEETGEATYYATLQTAIDAIGRTEGKAQPQGAEIVLLSDVYENITSDSKSYTLNMDGHKLTTGEMGKTIYTIKGGNVIIKNGTIYGAYKNPDRSGTIRAIDASEAELELVNCRITDNEQIGIYASKGSLTLTNSAVSNNGSNGISATGCNVTVLGKGEFNNNKGGTGFSIYVLNADLTMDGGNNIIDVSNNSGTDTGSGAIAVRNGNVELKNVLTSHNIYGSIVINNTTQNVTLENVEIANNTEEVNYSALYVTTTTGTITATECKIHDNIVTGARTTSRSFQDFIVALYGNGAKTFNNCRFYNNTGNTASGYYPKGVVFVRQGTADFIDCTFTNNTDFTYGGVIYAYYYNSSAVSAVNLKGGMISGNKTKYGAVYAYGYSTSAPAAVQMEGTVIRDNTATDANGSGVYMDRYGKFEMKSGAIYDNKPYDLYSSGTSTAGSAPVVTEASEMVDPNLEETYFKDRQYVWKRGNTTVSPSGISRGGGYVATQSLMGAALNTRTNETYATLNAAVDAARSGDTIRLINPGPIEANRISCDAQIYVQNSKAVTIELNGFTVEATGTAANYRNNNNGLLRVGTKANVTLVGDGKLCNKVFVGSNSTLNINGNVDIQTMHYNERSDVGAPLICYGIVNVNSNINTLKTYMGGGTFHVAEGVTVGMLRLEANTAFTDQAYPKTVTIDGNVGDMELTQQCSKTVRYNSYSAVTINGNVGTLTAIQDGMRYSAASVTSLTINGSVDDMTLTQGSTSSGAACYGRITTINGPVGSLNAVQAASANTSTSVLELNNEIGNLTLKHLGSSSKYYPITIAGENFFADSMVLTPAIPSKEGVTSIDLVNTDENAARNDIVMIQLPKQYERTEELAANGDWRAPELSNKPVTVVDGIDYNYLTKVAVGRDGNIVLRKDHSVCVYLDPVNGSDDNTGLALSQPLQTLEKAFAAAKDAYDKKLLEEPVIYMKSALEVSSGELNITDEALKDVRLQRYPTYKGALIKVTSGEFTLGKITIDGASNSKNKASAEAPLITVSRGATLNITDGAVLQNNYNAYNNLAQNGSGFSYEGGAVWNAGTLNMSGGVIQGSSAACGSGVFTQGTFNFSGGKITNNHGAGTFTENSVNASFNNAGGGVFVAYKNGVMNMSGGEISDNTAKMGGGISLSNRDLWYTGSTLNMTGGSITGNTATETNAGRGSQAGGGGIYIEMDCVANISGGEITGNRCEGNFLGGGGIYANGDDAAEKKNNINAGTVYLTNVLISENTGGAGVAVCEDGDMRVYLTDGGIIHGNKSGAGKAYDLQALPYGGTHGGLIGGVQSRGQIYISRYMLGNGEYLWKDYDTDELIYSGALRSHIQGLNAYSGAESITGEKDIHVRITGNHSKGGGSGVGANGDIIIGKDTDTDDRIDITVIKDWGVNLKENLEAAKDIAKIDIYYDLWSTTKPADEISDTEVPSEASGWRHEDTVKSSIAYEHDGQGYNTNLPYWPNTKFEGWPKTELSSGKELTYRVTEKVDAEGRFICEGINPGESENTFVVSNKIVYSLRLTKQVVDMYESESIEEAVFKFNVTLKDSDGNPYTNESGITDQGGNPVVFKENGIVEVMLKAGESVEFFGLENGASYTIEEEKDDDYNTSIKVDWGTGTSAGGDKVNGTIVSNTIKSFGVTNVEFTNETKEPHGSLTINKTVKGVTGNTERPWKFNVKLMNDNGEPLAEIGKVFKFTYVKDMGTSKENGNVRVDEDGMAVFYANDSAEGSTFVTLNHGQSVTIDGLPVGAKYLVTEEEANTGDYVTTVTGEEGSVVKNQTQEAKFTNTQVGNLTVHKTVEGTDADTEKDWEFTVNLNLTDEEGNSLLAGTENAEEFITYRKYHNAADTGVEEVTETGNIPVDAGSGKAEFTVLLKHGEYVTIGNLPTGTQYEVTEKEANTGSYITMVNDSDTQVNGSSGTIEIRTNKTTELHFVNSLQKTDIEGKKVWDDAVNQDGKRPQIITVNLYADGVLSDSVGVTSAGADNNDQWNWKFSDLPRYKDGKEIDYTVAEEAVRDYSVSYSKAEDGTIIITNQYTPGQTSYTVEKRWDDNNNQDNLRPESITVQLMQNGTAMGAGVTLNAANNWTYEWKNLPQKSDGKDIVYTVAEIGTITGYTVSYNHTENLTVITNTHTPNRPNRPGGGGGNPSGPRGGGDNPGGPGTPTTTIDEPGVPLADLPPEAVTELLEDSDVPLAALPRTGDSRHNGMLMMLFGIAGLGMLLSAAGLKKRKDESDD